MYRNTCTYAILVLMLMLMLMPYLLSLPYGFAISR